LAPIIVQSLFDIMVEICRNEGVTILLVEQNVELVFEIADHCCVLETGRVALTGPAAVLRENESIRRTYLGY
jgi:branched-chain amino acid transport system ATP-binding protein